MPTAVLPSWNFIRSSERFAEARCPRHDGEVMHVAKRRVVPCQHDRLLPQV
jgi:hypothetical protein